VHEVERPSFVRSQTNALDRTTAQREFTSHRLTYLEAGSAVNAADSLVIVDYTIAAQQHNHSGQPVPTMLGCQCNESQAKRLVVSPRLVVEKLAIDTDPSADRSSFSSKPFFYGLHGPCAAQALEVSLGDDLERFDVKCLIGDDS
jgi:hypothetical protein